MKVSGLVLAFFFVLITMLCKPNIALMVTKKNSRVAVQLRRTKPPFSFLLTFPWISVKQPIRTAVAMSTLPDQSAVTTTKVDAKQVVHEYVAAFNAGNMDKLKELLAEDAEIQGVLGKYTFEKVEPIWWQLIEGYGMQLEIQELVSEGGTVAARYIERGTFKVPAFGNEPTGKSYELVAMEFFTINEEGKIQRRWGARDAASQARQLGLPL
jgi:predicted ester cyclase